MTLSYLLIKNWIRSACLSKFHPLYVSILDLCLVSSFIYLCEICLMENHKYYFWDVYLLKKKKPKINLKTYFCCFQSNMWKRIYSQNTDARIHTQMCEKMTRWKKKSLSVMFPSKKEFQINNDFLDANSLTYKKGKKWWLGGATKKDRFSL